MDRTSGQKLLFDSLNGAFDRDRFVYLIKNILNHVEEAPFTYKGNYIFSDFADSIKSVERLGKYKDPEGRLIDILVVNLKKGTTLERARTKQRNFVAKYLKGSRGGVLKDAALVSFVSPEGHDWRLSLVKMEYKFDEKGKVKEEFTPARRYSFLVGQNENSHTAQSRLLPLLLNDEDAPSLEELETAFSVEIVTKEFFEKYRDLFLRLKESLDDILKIDSKVKADFDAKGIHTVDFAKKLLGQIVFLYFLQKKGWFGVQRGNQWGSGSKHFLRELFQKKYGDYKNFFNDILEPLFYEALRLERPGDYYSRFDCRIPFLNGGLFDPINDYDWWDTDIVLRDDVFSNTRKTKEGDTGDGILDIFDRYNFTVKEDEPLEKEVAVDPEMLGKVFENLLEVKNRKSKGTYYTPREIVHYMCQESLTDYLATELQGKISKEDAETLIKYGESVVEHDSRVVNRGRETKTYSFKLPESVRKFAKPIDEKLSAVRVCDPAVGSGAFPVGMMNEIVRTRNALTPFIDNNGERSTYHFKRQAIQNCLYGVDIDPGAIEIAKLRLWLSLVVDEEERETIQPLPNLDYKIVQGDSLFGVEINLFNQQLFKQLEELKPLYFNETSARKKQKFKNEIDDLISQLTDGHKDFDFEVYFSEVFHEKDGFDVVIANPPYGGYIDAQRVALSKLYPNTTKQFKDIFKVFIELGLNRICAPSGILCYITPNTLIRQARYKDVRKFLMGFTIIELVNLGEEVFEQVVVPTCFFFVKKEAPAVNTVIMKDISHDSKFTGELLSVPSENIPQSHFLKTTDGAFATEDDKLEENQSFLEDLVDFKDAGINYQRVNVGMSEKGKSDLGQRLLYEGGQESNKDVEFWKGVDINKYFIARSTDRYVRMNTIPSLKKNERVILNRDYFAKVPKLIWRQTAPHLVVAIDKRGIWFGRSIQGALIKNTKGYIDYRYLCGILNSSFMQFKYNSFVREEGRVFPQVKWSKIRKLPIPDVQPDSQVPIITLVDNILEITQAGDYLQNIAKQAEVRKYEKQIDQLVYNLYGLSPEEIKIIEEHGN
ncbi:MAG: Eco57I restriction-modification methylase domain-containing protein [Thermoleophilia bacterium]